MNISKLSAFLLGLSLFLLVVPISRADAPAMKNVESACLETTRCNASGATGLCAPDEPYPLVWGHRAHLAVKSGLSSGKVFVQECLEFGGAEGDEQICLNVPIVADTTAPSGWRLKNYKADQNNNVKWTTDKQMFIDAKKEECLNSYVNRADGAVICANTWDNYLSTPEGIAIDEFLDEEENYQFNGLYTAGGSTLQSITSYDYTANLGSKFEWGSSTTHSITRYFRVITYTNPREGTSGSDPSNKVGQLGFLVNEEACETSVNYDPFGQVFDRTTLQPVENARVALYREMEDVPGVTPAVFKYKLVDEQNTPGIITRPFQNPVSSSSFGMFSFVVPPGMYKLLISVNNPPAVLLEDLTVNQTRLDPNATELGNPLSILVGGSPQVLYPEVYQVSAMGEQISLPVINEGNVPERRDLSVLGLRVEDPKVLFHRRRVNSAGDNIIRGRINKPLGIVTARRGTDVLGSTSADIQGEFRLVISSDQLPRGESYRLQASSVPLVPVVPTSTPTVRLQNWLNALMDLLLPTVHAQTTAGEVIVEPRLNYLEGYAYDASGSVLKNALVTIFDKSLGVPVYNVQADEEGFFKITSEQLPRNDYAIYYTPEGSSSIVSITAEKFYTQNKEYIEMKKIDVNKPQYSKPAEVYLTQNPEPSQGANETMKPKVTGTQDNAVMPTGGAGPSDSLTQQISPTLLMYVAILLLLIVGAGLLIVYYMKRKQEPHLYE